MEYIDIFDENNNPTGQIKEKGKAHEEGDFHRTAHVWIINDKNELLLQKRSANKKSHPNCWDISGAGHIKAGESVIDGAIRELKEELGVEAEEKDLQYIATIKSTKNPKNMEFGYVYLLRCNKKISDYIFEDEEVSEVKYVYYEELEKMVKDKAEGLLLHDEEFKKLFEYIRNKEKDKYYIDIAIEISKNAKYPYGAIVVKDDEIIGRSDDKTLMETSMYSHAELEAIESASKNKNLYGDLKGATMYVSCEPCMMCMGAILYEEFSKIVYAATLQDSNDNYCPEMITNIDELVKYGNKIEIIKELHREKAVDILKRRGELINMNIDKKTNIFVLHSLNGDTINIWGQDIKENFNKRSIEVILPKFPIRADSSYEKFKEILKVYLDNKILNENSIVIGHSIGNAYFIRFCKEMNYIPKAYIAVAPGAVYNIPSNRNDYIVKVKEQAYCKQEQLDFIKEKVKVKYCLYSDEDEPKEEMFKRFIEDTKSKGIYLKYYNHFDGYHRIYKIPELTELINKILNGDE